MAHQAGALIYIRFQWYEATRSISTPHPSLDEMVVHRRVIRNIKLAGTHLYTWVETGTVRVECQEHNTTVPSQGSNPDHSSGGRASTKLI